MNSQSITAQVSSAVAALDIIPPSARRKIELPKIAVMCSTLDENAARAIWAGINAHPDKASVWLAEENLLPGQDWALEIEKVLEKYDFIVIALSGASVTREGYLQREIKRALEAKDTRDPRANKIVVIMLDHFEIPRALRDQSPFQADDNLGANIARRIQAGYDFYHNLG